MSSTADEQQKFQLTIRCAMQSFADYNVECPDDWSVLQLKEHLSQVCVSKPDPARQRLIYAGRCLENGQQIREVLMLRRDGIVRNDPVEKQVIHLVHIGGMKQRPPASSNNNNSSSNSNSTSEQPGVEGLRRRNLPSTNLTTGMPSPQPFQPSQMYMPYNFPAHSPLFIPSSPNSAAENQSPPQSYEAWMAAYQNYMGQMAMQYQQQHQMMMFGGGGASPMISTGQMGQQPMFAGFAAAAAAGHPQPPQAIFFHNGVAHQFQAVHQQPHQQQNGGDALVAAGEAVAVGVPQAVGAAAGVVPDFLDIVYKSVRFALLAMILYLYSSLERFVFVLAIVALFWLVHRRRDQQRQAQQQAQQRQVVQQAAAAVQQQVVQQPALVENGGGDEVVVPQPAAESDENGGQQTAPVLQAVQQQRQMPSAWNVFFTVVQSFFTSLVPAPAPAPFDVN